MNVFNTTTTLSQQKVAELETVWPLCVLGVLTNSAQLVCLYRSRHGANSNQLVIASLSLADLAVVIVRPIQLTLSIFGKLKYDIGVVLTHPLIYSGLLHILVMTIDRLFAIWKPFWHRLHMTKKRAIKMCLITWFMSILLGAPTYLMKKKARENLIGLLIVAACFTYIVCYTFIIITVCNRHRDINGHKKESSESRGSNGKHLSERRTLKLCLAISLIYVLCNLPTTILIYIWRKEKHAQENLLVKWVQHVYLINCSLNSIVYFWMTKGSKKRRSNNIKMHNVEGTSIEK